jgi:ribosomal protein L37AE/L43A
MREKMARFMAGRYGGDQLNRFIAIGGCVLFIAGMFVRGTASLVMYCAAMGGLVWSYCRMFSRNIYKRRAENDKYLRIKQKLSSDLCLKKECWNQRRDYKFFTCPACHTKLRVPKGKGKINIVCRKCGNSFQGKT